MLLLQVVLLLLFTGTLLLHECSCVNGNFVTGAFGPSDIVVNHIAVDEDLKNIYIGAENA